MFFMGGGSPPPIFNLKKIINNPYDMGGYK